MKIKILFSLTLILLMFSCIDKKTQKNNSNKTDSIRILQTEEANEFVNLFKPINPKGLHIYPPKWDMNGKVINTPFEGVVIDVNKYRFTNDSKIFANIDACKEGSSNIYAIGRFDIDAKYIGLIIRQYSQYDESAIQLVLWDKEQNKITKGIDLADSFGDEGWYFDKESWIIEYKANSKLEIVTRRLDSEYDEELKNKTFKDSLKTSVFTNGIFNEYQRKISDTIQFKLKERN